MHGVTTARLHGRAVARLRGCAVARLRGCAVARSRGCAVARLRGCAVARLRGCQYTSHDKIAGIATCSFCDAKCYNLISSRAQVTPRSGWWV